MSAKPKPKPKPTKPRPGYLEIAALNLSYHDKVLKLLDLPR